MRILRDKLALVRFRCDSCRSNLIWVNDSSLECERCAKQYTPLGNQFVFTSVNAPFTHDRADSIKQKFKRFPRLYTTLIAILSPVYPQGWIEISRLKKRLSPSDLALNVGSGATSIGSQFINVDLMPYESVDIVCDLSDIPLQDQSVDSIVSIAVLEHVIDPKLAVQELVRILKPGGTLLVFVPFIQGFHASPHDYQRYTLNGLVELVRPLRVTKSINVGPTSGLIWILAEWLALVLSFGISRAQVVLALFFAAVLSPLKFIDVLLRKYPGAENISTGFILVATKSTTS